VNAIPDVQYDIKYLLMYVLVLNHVPIYIGHLCLTLFATCNEYPYPPPHHPDDQPQVLSQGERGPSLWTMTPLQDDHFEASRDVLLCIISCAFLVMMQAYLFLVTRFIQTASALHAYPSLLYSGQLYYYLFWYLIVTSTENTKHATSSSMDGLYIAMIIMSNLHVVLANTGIYSDITQYCCVHPASMQCLTVRRRVYR
jgi:hypothetical protein